MLMRSKKNKQEIVGTEIIDSIKISENFYTKQENRLLTLLLKGLIVYLITAGSVGGTLTATGTSFNHFVFNIVIIIMSIVISLIYYNKKSENIGDILYLFGIIIFGIYLGAYINSGFYAWMNDVIGAAAAYFNLPDVGGYNQIIKNSELTVTIAACYLGAVIVILVNMSVAKKMIYMDLFLDALIVLFLPLYFGLEPNYIYFVMLISGFIFASIWRNTGRYVKVNNNSVYIRTKHDITYAYNVKAHLYSFLQVFLCIVIVLSSLYVVVPKDLYNLYRSKSDTKEYTDDYVQTFITSGIAGFFNRYKNKAGISSGKLGGVNSVSLDYETDLKITFTPYAYEPIYLRTFIGGNYEPYANRWNIANPTILNRDEADLLAKEYIGGNPYSGKGTMIVENIDAEFGEYSLYFSRKDSNIKIGEIAQREYFPLYDEISFKNKNDTLSTEEKDYWLYVPNDNVPSIINTLNKINIPEETDNLEKVQYIKEYFLNNIPYTLRPGSTPYRKDFVNYFLDTNKKGYCVHFASAATLMLRYLGIPARYVEGYVFDYSESSKTTIDEGLKYEDFFSGYNSVGKVPVLTAEITDASGHAWVEIYQDSFGWIPVDLTPPSSDTDSDSEEGFFARLLNRLNSNNTIAEDESGEGNTISIDSRIVRNVIITIFVILAVMSFLYFGILYALSTYKYSKADINTKLILKYHIFLHKKSKKLKNLRFCNNYREQINTITGNEKYEKIILILEKAGFSNIEISDEEFKEVIMFFKKHK